jgi:hypothetical protein
MHRTNDDHNSKQSTSTKPVVRVKRRKILDDEEEDDSNNNNDAQITQSAVPPTVNNNNEHVIKKKRKSKKKRRRKRPTISRRTLAFKQNRSNTDETTTPDEHHELNISTPNDKFEYDRELKTNHTVLYFSRQCNIQQIHRMLGASLRRKHIDHSIISLKHENGTSRNNINTPTIITPIYSEKPLKSWTIEDVCNFIIDIDPKFHKYSEHFIKHRVDGQKLLNLHSSPSFYDKLSSDFKIAAIGNRLMIGEAIEQAMRKQTT